MELIGLMYAGYDSDICMMDNHDGHHYKIKLNQYIQFKNKCI